MPFKIRLECGINVTQSWLTLCDPMDYTYSPWNFPGQNTGVGSLSLLQRIFQTQGLNPGLPRCRQILYQLSHQESPRILEWVAYPLSSGSSQPRNQTRVSCTAGGLFTNWAMREAQYYNLEKQLSNQNKYTQAMKMLFITSICGYEISMN